MSMNYYIFCLSVTSLGPFHTTYMAHIRKKQECNMYVYFCSRSFTHMAKRSFLAERESTFYDYCGCAPLHLPCRTLKIKIFSFSSLTCSVVAFVDEAK